MDNNSWRAAQGQMAQGQGGIGEASAMPNVANAVAATTMDNVTWRTQLQNDSRQRIVNKIMDTLKRRLPFSGQEGLQELNKIAVRLEENIYTAATSQQDYLRKISLKILTMETKSQNTMASSNTSKNPPDPGQGYNAQGQMAQGQGGIGEASAMPNAANAVAATTMDNFDWRTQLQNDSRQRIVNKIMDTLKRHLPFSGQEGLQELNKIAVRLEENIYTAATTQQDYLRRISLKMLTMETKSQNTMASSNTSKNPPDPGQGYNAQGQMAQGQGGIGEASAMPNAANAVAATTMDNVAWRTQLQNDSRQRIVNKIMDTLKRHLPFSGQEGLQELNKIAVRLEENIYTAATTQQDYLRRISLKMLTMETKSQNTMTSSNTSKNPPDPDEFVDGAIDETYEYEEEYYDNEV